MQKLLLITFGCSLIDSFTYQIYFLYINRAAFLQNYHSSIATFKQSKLNQKMSLIVKVFVFAMFIAFVMAQLPDLSALPIPEGMIPAIPGMPGGSESGSTEAAPAAEAYKRV